MTNTLTPLERECILNRLARLNPRHTPPVGVLTRIYWGMPLDDAEPTADLTPTQRPDEVSVLALASTARLVAANVESRRKERIS